MRYQIRGWGGQREDDLIICLNCVCLLVVKLDGNFTFLVYINNPKISQSAVLIFIGLRASILVAEKMDELSNEILHLKKKFKSYKTHLELRHLELPEK